MATKYQQLIDLEFEATLSKGKKVMYVVWPKGASSYYGFEPVPWSAEYVRASSPAKACSIVKDKYLERYKNDPLYHVEV